MMTHVPSPSMHRAFRPIQRAARAFTLVEVALALAIVSIVVIAAIGLLLPSQRTINEVLTGSQATRLREEVENEYAVVRPGETFPTPFDKAYDMVKKGKTQDGLLCAFFYRANNSTTTPDGRLAPFPGSVNNLRPGEDYVIQSTVMTCPQFKANANYREAVEGKVFVLRVLPIEGLVSETSSPLPTGFLPLPANGLSAFLAANPSTAYPLAVIPASVEFYLATDLEDPSKLFNSIPDPVTKVTPGGKTPAKPIITLNIGFRR